MKRILILCAAVIALVAGSAQADGSGPIPPRGWVDNYPKIVALKGLVNPAAGAHLSMKTAIESNVGRTIVFDSARTYYDTISVQQSIDIGANTTLDLNGSTVWFFGDIPNAKGFNVTGHNVTIKNGKIYWTSLGGYSQTNGEYGNPICIGEYDSVGVDISGTRILNINFKHDRTENGTIAIFGQAHDILIDGCTADTLASGALVLAHWGRPPNTSLAPSGTNYTTHPYNLTIRNCTVRRMTTGASEMISLSGAYNVKVSNCRLTNGKSFTQVYCGDFGYGYALPTTASGGIALDKYTIYGQGISFENCFAYINDVPDAYNVVGKPDYTQTPALFDTIVAAMPVHFENCFAINSLGSSGSSGWNIQNSRGVSIENCFATGFDAGGILIGENAWTTKVRGGLYEKNVYGVITAYGTDSLKPRSVVIDGTHFRSNSGGDIYAGFSNGMIYGCTFGDTLVTSTSPYAVYTTNKAFNINIIGNEVQSVGTAAFSINQNSSASCFNNYVRSALTKYAGVTPNAFMGISGETFQLPAGAVIQPSSSYLIFRAINNTLRFNYNAGTGAISAFYGADTDADVQFFEDSALFTFGSGAGGIKLYNSSTGSITLSGAQTGGNITYRFPNVVGTAGQVLADSGTGGLYWSSSGGGGGTFTQIGTMTADPAFASSTADNDWLGMGATAGRIRFEDGTLDTIAFMQNVAAFYGTDTADIDLTVSEGALTFFRASSTTALFTITNVSGQNVLDVTATSGIDAVLEGSTTADHAFVELDAGGSNKDAYVKYHTATGSLYWYNGIDASDSGAYKIARDDENFFDPDDSVPPQFSFRATQRTNQYRAHRHHFQDTSGTTIGDLRRGSGGGLLDIDQIGDSSLPFRAPWGVILGTDTTTSNRGVKLFTFKDAFGLNASGDGAVRRFDYQAYTTVGAAAGNDSTMNIISCSDSSASGQMDDTLTAYVDVELAHRLDSIVVYSLANAAGDSVGFDYFRGPHSTQTSVRRDSTYNTNVFTRFHPTTNTAMTAVTRSHITGTSLVGASQNLRAGRYYMRCRTYLTGTNSSVKIVRAEYYWRAR